MQTKLQEYADSLKLLGFHLINSEITNLQYQPESAHELLFTISNMEALSKTIKESFITETKSLDLRVSVYDDGYQFWASTEEKLTFKTIEQAHKWGKQHATRDGYWYTISHAGKELIDERTKNVKGKFVTGYLKK